MSEQPSTWVQSVSGPRCLPDSIIADAHNHLWISRLANTSADLPVLDSELQILEELCAFRIAGGSMILDCQPVGCGRDANRLRQLSLASQVIIIGCTGFHRQRYYPANSPLWHLSAEKLSEIFISEIRVSMVESVFPDSPIKAGFIKVAIEQTAAGTSQPMLEAAAHAAMETDSAIEIHTEKGSDAEAIVHFFTNRGVPAQKLILCHIDKRPDFGLHQALAKEKVLLEYDTFFRQQYAPERNLWPLLQKMIEHGYDSQIALATDMADSTMWQSYGGKPGLAALITEIKPGLERIHIPAQSIEKLLGKNILSRIKTQNPLMKEVIS